MTIIAAILLATLTRAEIIDRMRATPVTKQNGLVQVVANCPSDMREEFQSPIAGFASDICTRLYQHTQTPVKHFQIPGILIYLGDERTNRTDVITRTRKRDNGLTQTRIFLPAPAFSDVDKFSCELVKAFYLSVLEKKIETDEDAIKLLRDADPDLRAKDTAIELAKWRDGQIMPNDDEFYIKKSRAVLRPGIATKEDILHFASRLVIYPEIFSAPFCGRYNACSFKDAIDYAAKDPRIRFIAYAKAPQIALFGGGRGEKLSIAAEAYSTFLRELAAYKKSPEQLRDLLEDADEKLNLALEEIRNREKGILK